MCAAACAAGRHLDSFVATEEFCSREWIEAHADFQLNEIIAPRDPSRSGAGTFAVPLGVVDFSQKRRLAWFIGLVCCKRLGRV